MEQPPPAAFHLGYRPVLDGLRGLAVLAVMAYHSDPHSFFRGGFLGVDVFFVLSGFLVTVLLWQEHQRTGSVHVPRFYLRRVLRLWPALFVMLSACCVFAAFRTRPDRAASIYRAVLLTACSAANGGWFWSMRLDLLGHAWSLSLEEQFYLVWPVLLFLLFRLGVRCRWIVGLVVLAMAAAAVFRTVLWMSGGPAGLEAATTSLPSRADSLLAGCLVGVLACSGRLPRSRGPRVALWALAGVSTVALLGLGIGAESGGAYLYLGGFTVVAAATAAVIAALVTAPPRPVGCVLGAPVLVWIGRISYGLYLWHFPMLSFAPKVIHGVLPVTRGVPCLDAAMAVALTFAAAALSYYAVERPFLRWKARLGKCCSP